MKCLISVIWLLAVNQVTLCLLFPNRLSLLNAILYSVLIPGGSTRQSELSFTRKQSSFVAESRKPFF